MNPELLLHSSNHDIALIAHIVEPLMIIRPGREDIAVTACGSPLRAIQEQHGVRLELRVGPGVMCDISEDMVVMIGNAEIVHSYRFSKGDDLGLWVIARVLAVAGVQMKVPLKPDTIGE